MTLFLRCSTSLLIRQLCFRDDWRLETFLPLTMFMVWGQVFSQYGRTTRKPTPRPFLHIICFMYHNPPTWLYLTGEVYPFLFQKSTRTSSVCMCTKIIKKKKQGRRKENKNSRSINLRGRDRKVISLRRSNNDRWGREGEERSCKITRRHEMQSKAKQSKP